MTRRTLYTHKFVSHCTPELVVHRTERIKKRNLQTHCRDCGAKLITVPDGVHEWHDTKTGKMIRSSWFLFKCPNKRWYNLIKHWNGTQHKIIEERM